MNCNCRYCGAALPTMGGHCPNCGRMIPMDQQQMLKDMIDPRWNNYRDKNTAQYKQESANDVKIGKTIVIIGLIIMILLIIAIAKSMG